MNIPEIQQYLQEHELDGWLLADFHGRNSIAISFLQITSMVTRRSFYYIPAVGTAVGLIHAIEKHPFQHLPGELQPFSSYRDLENKLRELLPKNGRIAMEYAVGGRLPYIGLVDAGTIELVRSFGVDVVSSADLVSHFQARLTAQQIAMHREAATKVIEVKDAVMKYMSDVLKDRKKISEYDVTQFILEQFDGRDMETQDSPICAVDANAGNPHYEPTKAKSKVLAPGQLILVDLWGRLKKSRAVYADITWVAFAGSASDIPDRYRDLFQVVMQARDRAVSFVKENYRSKPVYGYQVDDACRKVIVDAGYAEQFFHRTGHSIGTEVHSTGPNIDNLETEDRRQLQPGHLFSVEPGIYLDDCGFRSEIDVLITEEGPDVTTQPLQQAIIPLLS